MSDIDDGLKMADPELYEHLLDCIHKYEIRGSEETFLKDWIGKALVTESLLFLLREKKVNIVGLMMTKDNEIEPMFEQNQDNQTTEEVFEE